MGKEGALSVSNEFAHSEAASSETSSLSPSPEKPNSSPSSNLHTYRNIGVTPGSKMPSLGSMSPSQTSPNSKDAVSIQNTDSSETSKLSPIATKADSSSETKLKPNRKIGLASGSKLPSSGSLSLSHTSPESKEAVSLQDTDSSEKFNVSPIVENPDSSSGSKLNPNRKTGLASGSKLPSSGSLSLSQKSSESKDAVSLQDTDSSEKFKVSHIDEKPDSSSESKLNPNRKTGLASGSKLPSSGSLSLSQKSSESKDAVSLQDTDSSEKFNVSPIVENPDSSSESKLNPNLKTGLASGSKLLSSGSLSLSQKSSESKDAISLQDTDSSEKFYLSPIAGKPDSSSESKLNPNRKTGLASGSKLPSSGSLSLSQKSSESKDAVSLQDTDSSEKFKVSPVDEKPDSSSESKLKPNRKTGLASGSKLLSPGSLSLSQTSPESKEAVSIQDTDSSEKFYLSPIAGKPDSSSESKLNPNRKTGLASGSKLPSSGSLSLSQTSPESKEAVSLQDTDSSEKFNVSPIVENPDSSSGSKLNPNRKTGLASGSKLPSSGSLSLSQKSSESKDAVSLQDTDSSEKFKVSHIDEKPDSSSESKLNPNRKTGLASGSKLPSSGSLSLSQKSSESKDAVSLQDTDSSEKFNVSPIVENPDSSSESKLNPNLKTGLASGSKLLSSGSLSLSQKSSESKDAISLQDTDSSEKFYLSPIAGKPDSSSESKLNPNRKTGLASGSKLPSSGSLSLSQKSSESKDAVSLQDTDSSEKFKVSPVDEKPDSSSESKLKPNRKTGLASGSKLLSPGSLSLSQTSPESKEAVSIQDTDSSEKFYLSPIAGKPDSSSESKLNPNRKTGLASGSKLPSSGSLSLSQTSPESKEAVSIQDTDSSEKFNMSAIAGKPDSSSESKLKPNRKTGLASGSKLASSGSNSPSQTSSECKDAVNLQVSDSSEKSNLSPFAEKLDISSESKLNPSRMTGLASGSKMPSPGSNTPSQTLSDSKDAVSLQVSDSSETSNMSPFAKKPDSSSKSKLNPNRQIGLASGGKMPLTGSISSSQTSPQVTNAARLLSIDSSETPNSSPSAERADNSSERVLEDNSSVNPSPGSKVPSSGSVSTPGKSPSLNTADSFSDFDTSSVSASAETPKDNLPASNTFQSIPVSNLQAPSSVDSQESISKTMSNTVSAGTSGAFQPVNKPSTSFVDPSASDFPSSLSADTEADYSPASAHSYPISSFAPAALATAIPYLNTANNYWLSCWPFCSNSHNSVNVHLPMAMMCTPPSANKAIFDIPISNPFPVLCTEDRFLPDIVVVCRKDVDTTQGELLADSPSNCAMTPQQLSLDQLSEVALSAVLAAAIARPGGMSEVEPLPCSTKKGASGAVILKDRIGTNMQAEDATSVSSESAEAETASYERTSLSPSTEIPHTPTVTSLNVNRKVDLASGSKMPQTASIISSQVSSAPTNVASYHHIDSSEIPKSSASAERLDSSTEGKLKASSELALTTGDQVLSAGSISQSQTSPAPKNAAILQHTDSSETSNSFPSAEKADCSPESMLKTESKVDLASGSKVLLPGSISLSQTTSAPTNAASVQDIDRSELYSSPSAKSHSSSTESNLNASSKIALAAGGQVPSGGSISRSQTSSVPKNPASLQDTDSSEVSISFPSAEKADCSTESMSNTNHKVGLASGGKAASTGSISQTQTSSAPKSLQDIDSSETSNSSPSAERPDSSSGSTLNAISKLALASGVQAPSTASISQYKMSSLPKNAGSLQDIDSSKTLNVVPCAESLCSSSESVLDDNSSVNLSSARKIPSPDSVRPSARPPSPNIAERVPYFETSRVSEPVQRLSDDLPASNTFQNLPVSNLRATSSVNSQASVSERLDNVASVDTSATFQPANKPKTDSAASSSFGDLPASNIPARLSADCQEEISPTSDPRYPISSLAPASTGLGLYNTVNNWLCTRPFYSPPASSGSGSLPFTMTYSTHNSNKGKFGLSISTPFTGLPVDSFSPDILAHFSNVIDTAHCVSLADGLANFTPTLRQLSLDECNKVIPFLTASDRADAAHIPGTPVCAVVGPFAVEAVTGTSAATSSQSPNTVVFGGVPVRVLAPPTTQPKSQYPGSINFDGIPVSTAVQRAAVPVNPAYNIFNFGGVPVHTVGQSAAVPLSVTSNTVNFYGQTAGPVVLSVNQAPSRSLMSLLAYQVLRAVSS
ncbi:mucin-17-like [Schistocerca gregaria]|uniref:mucin-17-like n=1 Tax=Schistocerca gregaria TaxID=7010 RepID=UPI00211E4FA1|nr:mucin-17-like [Schistocerca gregaria]